MQTINTCYQCENRHPACHDTCEKYLTAKAEWLEKRKTIRKNRNHFYALDDFAKQSCIKNLRKKGKLK